MSASDHNDTEEMLNVIANEDPEYVKEFMNGIKEEITLREKYHQIISGLGWDPLKTLAVLKKILQHPLAPVWVHWLITEINISEDKTHYVSMISDHIENIRGRTFGRKYNTHDDETLLKNKERIDSDCAFCLYWCYQNGLGVKRNTDLASKFMPYILRDDNIMLMIRRIVPTFGF